MNDSLHMNYDELTRIVNANPQAEAAILKIIEDKKKTTSMFIHELRNPLSLMKGTIQYIEMKNPQVKDYKYWDQLNYLIQDMEHMMTDASLLNACNHIKKENCDLVELVKSVVDMYMPQAGNRQIGLSFSVTEDCKSLLSDYSCDASKIKQVLSNLVKNALEATSPGNYIKVNLSCTNDNPSMLSICVANNGLPIPEDEIETIFLPFVTYKKGGTGIGLALAKKIVELHFGSISVTSDSELTCFTILLPL